MIIVGCCLGRKMAKAHYIFFSSLGRRLSSSNIRSDVALIINHETSSCAYTVCCAVVRSCFLLCTSANHDARVLVPLCIGASVVV